MQAQQNHQLIAQLPPLRPSLSSAKTRHKKREVSSVV